MRKPKEEPRVRGNTIVPTGYHRPDEFYSQASRFPAQCKSILQANAEVRAKQQDQEHAMRHGIFPPFDPKDHEIRQRYREQVVGPGHSTFKKCCDGIC